MSKQNELAQFADVVTVNSGKVGIGVSPSQKLHVEGAGNQFILLNNSTTNDGFYFKAGAGASSIQTNAGSHVMNFFTGGTERMRIDATGAVTLPHQPAFLVTKNSDQNNIATGSEVTVTWQAEVFDQNSDFASNVFTAPVTGKYLLTSAIRVDNLDTASNYYNFLFTTSNRVYRKIIDYGGLSGDPVYWFFSLTAIADMDAGDTASVKIYQNNGTAQMDIIGDVTRSYFSGYLVA